MRKLILAGSLAVTSLVLSSCGILGSGTRTRPDEFLVARSAPLVIPPDFALTPPRPGEPTAQGGDTTAAALQAMFGGPAPRSAAETAVLGEAGTDTAADGIRSTVGDPNTQAVDYGTTTRDIIAAPEGDAPEAEVSTPQ